MCKRSFVYLGVEIITEPLAKNSGRETQISRKNINYSEVQFCVRGGLHIHLFPAKWGGEGATDFFLLVILQLLVCVQ